MQLAAVVVTPAAACGITVRRDGQPFSAAISNELAGDVDEIQYDTDEGPCLDALRGGTVVQVDESWRNVVAAARRTRVSPGPPPTAASWRLACWTPSTQPPSTYLTTCATVEPDSH